MMRLVDIFDTGVQPNRMQRRPAEPFESVSLPTDPKKCVRYNFLNVQVINKKRGWQYFKLSFGENPFARAVLEFPVTETTCDAVKILRAVQGDFNECVDEMERIRGSFVKELHPEVSWPSISYAVGTHLQDHHRMYETMLATIGDISDASDLLRQEGLCESSRILDLASAQLNKMTSFYRDSQGYNGFLGQQNLRRINPPWLRTKTLEIAAPIVASWHKPCPNKTLSADIAPA